MPARWLLSLPAAALGAVAALTGTFVHGLHPGGFPVGLGHALLLVGLVQLLSRGLTGGRVGGLAAGVAWCAVTLPLASVRPEGDLLVEGTATGYAWLVGGLVIVGAGALLPSTGPPPDASGPDTIRR